MRVAVIGAGAAGLVALRHLLAKPELFQARCFEQSSVVGGTWVYTDRTGKDGKGLPVHSSMYRDLRTNLPKEVMAFPDFPFKKTLSSFISHQEVLTYLEDYTHHFNLQPHIEFDTSVQHVCPVVSEDVTRWQVTTAPSGSKEENKITHTFDAIIVCNGHYSIPLTPSIPGLESFQGRVLHSHDYRYPEPFQDKVVMCLGAAASGQDISLDVATTAKHVYLSSRKPPLQSLLPDNVSLTAGLQEMNGDTAVLSDGSELHIDVLMFCTGYHYTYPFLDRSVGLDISRDERVTPLYKHIIHTDYTTLSIIGVCKTICPFPQFDCQVRFVLAALEGSMVLPSHDSMMADIEADFSWRHSQGMPPHYAHTMGNLQWDYNDSLAELAGFEPIPRVVRTLYDHVHATRVKNLPNYKKLNYSLLSDTDFREITQDNIT